MRAGREPVAMIVFSVSSFSIPPSFFVTSIVLGLVSLPLPSMSVTPQLLNRPRMPLTCTSTTLFLRSMIFWRFGVSVPLNSMPKSAMFFAWWNASTEASRAFVGMQPRFRQVPPTSVSSMTVTCAPSCAALSAATYPPGPAPITVSLIWTLPPRASHSRRRQAGWRVRPRC